MSLIEFCVPYEAFPTLPDAVSPSGRSSGLWLDAPGAAGTLVARAGGDPLLRHIGEALIEEGFAVIEGAQDHALIDQAVRDYEAFLDQHAEEASLNRDEAGRQFRLANLHLASAAAMRLAKAPDLMRILDFLFGREAAVHTSLTFQYSTMQQLHRDSPYFHTFPESQFIGVWTALQEIHPDSGPLSYVPGSHRAAIDQWEIYNHYRATATSDDAARWSALGEYQRRIVEVAQAIGPRRNAVLRKGDVAMWHPQLIHGGSPAVDPSLKRHSMVVHCCPADTFVFVDDVFLAHQDAEPPRPYYTYAESLGRRHGDFVRPGFMGSI